MARNQNIWLAAALALALAAPAAQAQTLVSHPRHHVVHRGQTVLNEPGAIHVVRPGDIVVHARRSYLDPGPGTWTEVGTGDRYATDTTPASMADFGSSFANRGFDLLPSRFNPPGRPEPLFQFSEP
ncbi:MAG: hypothetical protein ACLQPI_12080 [Limisphaerales bacterium]